MILWGFRMMNLERSADGTHDRAGCGITQKLPPRGVKNSTAAPRLLAVGVGMVQGLPGLHKELAVRSLVSSDLHSFTPEDVPGTSLGGITLSTHQPASVSGLWTFIHQVRIAFLQPNGHKESLLCRKFPAQCLASCGTQQLYLLSLSGSTLKQSSENELQGREQFPVHLSCLLTCLTPSAASKILPHSGYMKM